LIREIAHVQAVWSLWPWLRYRPARACESESFAPISLRVIAGRHLDHRRLTRFQVAQGDLDHWILEFEIASGIDRNRFVVALCAWRAVRRDFPARAGVLPYGHPDASATNVGCPTDRFDLFPLGTHIADSWFRFGAVGIRARGVERTAVRSRVFSRGARPDCSAHNGASCEMSGRY
jgi:hypothetical protein